jgi:hypothetical protein
LEENKKSMTATQKERNIICKIEIIIGIEYEEKQFLTKSADALMIPIA